MEGLVSATEPARRFVDVLSEQADAARDCRQALPARFASRAPHEQEAARRAYAVLATDLEKMVAWAMLYGL